MQLTNTWYNRFKFLALVLLPGFSAAYFSLSQVWGLPNAEKVVGTVTIVDTFLGLLLKASTSQYKKAGEDTDGDLIVNDDGEERYLSLGIKEPSLRRIPDKDTVTLKVVNENPLRGG